jgi:hypothetical protein
MNKLFWLLLVAVACNPTANKEATTHNVKYFPDTLNIDTAFSNFLSRAGEPSIFKKNDSTEIYRVTFVSSARFIHDKIIRFEKNSDDTMFHIVGVMLPEQSLINKCEFSMTMKTAEGNNYWDSLKIGLQQCDFWKLPLDEPSCGEGILDGGTYLLEGRLNGKYQILYRHNPFNANCPKHEEINELLRIINGFTEFGGGLQYHL